MRSCLRAEGERYSARYDHTVRKGAIAFTDHSACIVEVAEAAPNDTDRVHTIRPARLREPATPVPPMIRPYNTAMARQRLSKPVQALLETDA